VSTAIAVGAGPNGLAAAITLAHAGVGVTVLEAAEEIGGATRSSETILPGPIHDHCSAIHPMAVGSPFLTTLGLDRMGWRGGCPTSTAPAYPGRLRVGLTRSTTAARGVLYRSVDPRRGSRKCSSAEQSRGRPCWLSAEMSGASRPAPCSR